MNRYSSTFVCHQLYYILSTGLTPCSPLSMTIVHGLATDSHVPNDHWKTLVNIMPSAQVRHLSDENCFGVALVLSQGLSNIIHQWFFRSIELKRFWKADPSDCSRICGSSLRCPRTRISQHRPWEGGGGDFTIPYLHHHTISWIKINHFLWNDVTWAFNFCLLYDPYLLTVLVNFNVSGFAPDGDERDFPGVWASSTFY